MISISFYIMAFHLFCSTALLSQNSPSPEVNKTIRATVDILKNSTSKDYKSFINNYYSRNYITNIDSMVNYIKDIKNSTEGADGISVENENGVLQINFTGAVDALIELKLEDEINGKIRSLILTKEKNSSEMTADENVDSMLSRRMRKLETLSNFNTDSEFEEFIKENFSPAFISEICVDQLLTKLKKLKVSVAAATMFNAKPAVNQNGVILELRGGKSADVLLSIEETDPFQIIQFEYNDEVDAFEKSETELLPITWDNYENLLMEEEAKGFSGVVLVVRNGKVEHHKGYGLANKELGVKNNDNTTYDIGSIPIDFTRAAILKLVDQGKISYADPISKFIPNVPTDKKPITIAHLMNNASGLHNFHGEAIDKDPDLTLISREEAIYRILNRSLLFEPGTDISPSHSGYGLLATIVEIVSGKTYETFLKEYFFYALNMKNTGPYGKASGLNPETMAVGYGKQASTPNIPTNWGPTSWLIKGSGGMVSNPMDLYLWNKGLHAGKILSGKSKEIYQQGKMALGGSERGYFAAYLRSSSNTIIMCSNSNRLMYPDTMNLFQSLSSLCK